MPRALIDMTGLIYGKLTVVGLISTQNGALWRCKCKCGAETDAYGGNLRTGNTTSCGCVRSAEKPDRQAQLAGQRFGRLTAVSLVLKRRKGNREWLCRCDCGVEKVVAADHLVSLETISCGCAVGRTPIRPRRVREMSSVTDHVRRAKVYGADGRFTAEEIAGLFAKQGGKCAMCAVELDADEYNKDHKVPLSRGGSNDIANIQLTCLPCNRHKYNRTPEEHHRLMRAA